MGVIDELVGQIKKQKGTRYRIVRLDPDNVSRKKVEGYQFLRKEDPEIKGTILEQHMAADGQIRIGNMAITKISEDAARRKEKKNEDKLKVRLTSIRNQYQKEGEDIKRSLGPSHAAFKPITEDKE